jgi:hypothetical protein
LITAPSLEVLDAWWRAISDKDIGFNRVTPDFYTFSSLTTIQNPNYAPQFFDKLIFTIMNDSRVFKPFPPQEFSNHISGAT